MSNNAKVGIACAFRHDPSKGKFIPAATLAPEGKSPYSGKVLPVVGWCCIATEDGKVFWSAVKYDSPWVWPKGSENEGMSHGAWIGTTRLAAYDCPVCHAKVKFVAGGGKKHRDRCPSCGSDKVNVDLIKDGSPEFFGMLGDLKGPLESLAAGALKDPSSEKFRFPVVMAGGTNLDPDKSLPPDALGVAQAHGRGLKSLYNMGDIDELRNIENWDLSILPEPTYGIADYEDVRNGLEWTEGLVTSRLKPWLPPPKPVPISPTVFTY